MVGDGSVGKTCLLITATYKEFPSHGQVPVVSICYHKRYHIVIFISGTIQ